MRELFQGTRRHIRPSNDIAGISWSVILKNVYALAFGIADELQFGSGLNDYAARADAYQNLDSFKALGSPGYSIPGSAAGINMNKAIYGSVGGAYQINHPFSGGVDFSLS